MADQKISQLNSLTKSTVATNDVLPIVDTSASETKKITYQELIQPQDDQFAIADNADNTKKVAFQVSGVTTSTTRTLTVPDANTTIVGTDATQTLTNKTLTAPQINMGGDATGDIYYRTSGGVTARLPIGTAGQIIQVSSSGIPEYIANPAAADASTTVKGVVEIATTAEITAGTSTGSTGAILAVPASAVGAVGASKIVQFTAATKYPAADGSLIQSPGKIYVTTTDITTTATTADIITAPIPANTIGTNGGVSGRIYFTWASATVTNKQILLKYGATTLATIVMTPDATTATTMRGFIDFFILGNGATNSQEGSIGVVGMSNATGVFRTVSTAVIIPIQGFETGTASEDSTTALNLTISIAQNASANDTFVMKHAYVQAI